MQKTNFRKGGAGAGNVGTYKDELRRGEEAEATEVPEQRAEDGTAAEPTEPAKDVKTLEEYFREKVWLITERYKKNTPKIKKI